MSSFFYVKRELKNNIYNCNQGIVMKMFKIHPSHLSAGLPDVYTGTFDFLAQRDYT